MESDGPKMKDILPCLVPDRTGHSVFPDGESRQLALLWSPEKIHFMLVTLGEDH